MFHIEGLLSKLLKIVPTITYHFEWVVDGVLSILEIEATLEAETVGWVETV